MSEHSGVSEAAPVFIPAKPDKATAARTYGIASGLERFRSAWKSYVLQSLLAGMTTLVILLALSLENSVVIAALGASAFIVFGRPFDLTARSRNVIGGHLLGFFVGSACCLLPQEPAFASLLSYALAVGLSVFIMVVLYMQHPPAAATALGVAVQGSSWEAFLAILTFTLVLSVVHFALKSRLRNLF
ncbi:MAG: HPP family protein [Dehalococcoidia bacterium]|jgi:CBS-domain-containing membrane protein|nr:HPP family protein [Dehalococcoidia bacterium]